MSQFLKYVTKKMQGGGDIGSLPGVLSLSAIQTKIKLDKDIKNQKALNAQATLSQYTPKPGDQERMNRAKDRYRTELTQPLNRAAASQYTANAWNNIVKPMIEMEGIASGLSGVRSLMAKPKRIPTSFYSEPVITRGPIANPWDGKGIRVEMEGSLAVPEGMMPYIGREEWVPTTPAEKVWASFFNGKARPIPPPHKKQRGGTAYVDSVFNAPNNKQIEWVQRLYQKNGKSIMVPGQTEPSTHFMESGNSRVYPTVVTMPDGSLKYLGKGAYDYADSTKTYIQFPTDKQAQWFGKNYKKGTGVLSKKKGGPIVDPRGQWAHPGKVTRIPGSDITMQGVPYPVYGVGSNGQEQMMYPGQDYNFGGASYVDEYPMMQLGGLSTGPIMPMINPIISKIAEWFSGPSDKKSKSPKSLYQTQTEVSNKRYHDFLDKLDSNDDKNYDSSSRFVNLSAGRFKGAKVAPDMINDIVAAAKANNVDPWVMLSLVGRESTFGSGIESNKERANNKQQLLSGWDVAEDYMPYDFDRYLADKKVPGMNVYKSKQGYFYGTDDENIVEQYLQKHPELIEGYTKKLASTPDLGNMDSFNLAAKRIKKKGIAKYNPGDPKYTYMVNQDMQLLKRDPELRAYMKSLGYQMGGSYPMMQGGGSWNKFDIPKAQNGLTAKDKNNIIGYIQKLSKNKSSVENSQAVPVNNSRELSKEDMQRIASMSKLMVPTNTREVLDAERKEKYGSQWEAEKIEDKRKKEERKTAAITRSKVLAGDDAASFTFPDGTTKKWKDMDWREQSYISGKNLGSWNNDNWTDYINPLALLGSLSEGIGTAPYEAKKTDSIKPYLFGVGAPLLTGALGSLGAKNAGQFVENIVSPIPGNLSSIGRYLTEKTPLRNAHKFNRSALTDDMLFNKEGVVNRQIFGDDAYNNFLQYGPTTRPNISQSDQMMDLVRAPKSNVRSATGEVFQVAKTMEDGAFKYPYFQEGNLWYTGQQRSNLAKELGKERIITTPMSDLWFAPAGESSVMFGDDISQGLIDSYSKGRRVLMPGASEYAKPSKYSVFEPHWWKGYKQIQEDGGQIYPIMQVGGQSTTGYSNLFPNHNDFLRRLEVFDYVKQQHKQGLDFHTKWLNSPMYNSMINASDPINAKQITDQRKKRLSAIDFKYVDTPYGKAGASSDKLGNIEIYPAGIGQKGVGVHEMSHVTDTGPGQNLIPAKDRIDITKYSLASENMPKYEAYKKYFNYVTEPSETRARLNEIRQGASENKLYDPFTQKVSPAIYNKLKNFKFNSNPGNDPLQQLRSAFSDDQILQMLNSVSQNNTQQDMMYAEQGGQMIRRADGSYSRKGLWDNIRANKGSGKKPTKEMLEQERKIKAKEMKNGGTNNPGFDALPDYVQANILSNMGYGGMTYPFMQKGGEPNGEMALGQMSAVSDKMSKLLKFVRPDDNLDPWIASKLAVMDHSADAIADYMMYGPDAQQQEEEMGQMMANGGYVVTRSDDRKGKTHKVTGPDGTVKYFGDSKLGQHPNDPERKAAFYARHEKNLKNNPHFRAFARKTWADGGEIEMMANGGYIGHDGKRHMSTTPTWSGNAGYQMGGEPCYECGGNIYQWGGGPKTKAEKSVGEKCGIQKGISKELAAMNAAANKDAAMWAKQAERNEKILAKEEAAKLAGELNFDYDWTGYPVEKAEKKAAMAQYKQFFQQNPNVFVADDTSGFSPEQKYIIASKLKQKIGTPVFGKNFQQQYGVDPRALDLQRLQSEMAPRMGGWEGMRNYLFNKKKYGGPAVGAEMDVTPEQLEALRKQGYEFEII